MSNRKLVRLFERDMGICWLCKEAVEWKHASKDHVVPKIEGGGNGIYNLRLAHRKCNKDRGRTFYPFMSKEEAYASVGPRPKDIARTNFSRPLRGEKQAPNKYMKNKEYFGCDCFSL